MGDTIIVSIVKSTLQCRTSLVLGMVVRQRMNSSANKHTKLIKINSILLIIYIFSHYMSRWFPRASVQFSMITVISCTFAAVSGLAGVLWCQAVHRWVHVHPAQRRKPWVVELVFYAGQCRERATILLRLFLHRGARTTCASSLLQW